ncbi:MAG TPA: prepilin-type N-terminal cleavage/methylation domain-containing protein [Verrucomicrobiales bacterium]|nr:prepilin-type N-terminal cleavage/methylation domain-containing protein [Verrucomicrobiales bacterium]
MTAKSGRLDSRLAMIHLAERVGSLCRGRAGAPGKQPAFGRAAQCAFLIWARTGSGRAALRAFTLIEIAVALAVVVIIVGLAYPSMKGLREERAAREPLTRLEEMVRSMRDRAMSEGRPYQIVFFSGGFVGSRLVDPYLNPEELLAHLESMEKQREERRSFLRAEWKRMEVERIGKRAADAGDEGEAGTGNEEAVVLERAGEVLERERMEWFRLEEKTGCELRHWGEEEWRGLDMAGTMVRWVFQPSGLAYPASARFRRGATVVEGSFRSLTGELYDEKIYVP